MTVRAPRHLKPSTRAWYRAVCDSYVLEDHHLRLLELAGVAWDRAEEARAIIAEHGTTYVDRFGAPRLHPAVNIERDSMASFARLVKALDLDTEPPKSLGRPPGGGL